MNPATIIGFHDELEKIAEQREDSTITSGKMGRLARYGAAGAAGAGMGYAGTKLVGRPLEKKLLKSNLVGRNPARALKYSAGLGAGLAAATALAQSGWADKLARKVRVRKMRKGEKLYPEGTFLDASKIIDDAMGPRPARGVRFQLNNHVWEPGKR